MRGALEYEIYTLSLFAHQIPGRPGDMVLLDMWDASLV